MNFLSGPRLLKQPDYPNAFFPSFSSRSCKNRVNNHRTIVTKTYRDCLSKTLRTHFIDLYRCRGFYIRIDSTSMELQDAVFNALFRRSFDFVAQIGRRRSIRPVESFKSVVSESKTASFCESYGNVLSTRFQSVIFFCGY